MSSIKREEAELQAAHAMVTMTPQTTGASASNYPGPPPPRQYSTTTTSIPSGPQTATIRSSPKYPFAATQDDKESQPHSAPAKQSLPSLSEALSQSRPADSYDHTPRSPPSSYRRRSASPQSAPYAPKYEDYRKRDDDITTKGPPNGSAPYESARYAPEPHQRLAYGPIRNTSPSSPRHSSHPSWTMNNSASSHTPMMGRSLYPEWAGHQRPTYKRDPRSPSLAAKPYIHGPQASGQQCPQPNESPRYITSYPVLSTSTLSGDQGPTEESSNDKYGKGPQYAESVKRQLENFDLEASLNEVRFQRSVFIRAFTDRIQVCENGHNVMQFGEAFRLRTHQAHRAGRISMSQPSVEEVKHALQYSSHIHEALSNILDRLEAQEAERAERSSKEVVDQQHAASSHGDVTASGQSESSGAGLAADGIKKRRGVC